MKQDVSLCTLRTNNYGSKCSVFEIHQDLCASCNENYFLSSDKLSCLPAPNQTETKGHIFSCKEMEECHHEVSYTGLSSNLEILLSCHKCKQISQIPFVSISGSASYSGITSLKEYNVEGDFTASTFRDFKGGKSVFCAEPSKESFNITDSNKWAFPSNCAVGVLNVDSLPDASDSATLTNVDRTKVAVFCGACETGYYPTFGEDNANDELTNMVASCTLIANC